MEVKPRFRDPEIMSLQYKCPKGVVQLYCFYVSFLFFFPFRLAVGQFGGHVLHLQAVAARTVVQEVEEEV